MGKAIPAWLPQAEVLWQLTVWTLPPQALSYLTHSGRHKHTDRRIPSSRNSMVQETRASLVLGLVLPHPFSISWSYKSLVALWEAQNTYINFIKWKCTQKTVWSVLLSFKCLSLHMPYKWTVKISTSTIYSIGKTKLFS